MIHIFLTKTPDRNIEIIGVVRILQKKNDIVSNKHESDASEVKVKVSTDRSYNT
jgi:hypothetical protein